MPTGLPGCEASVAPPSEAASTATDVGEPALIRAAQAGEHGALDELVRRHRGSAYALALQLLGDRDDALDVAQEAILRFVTSLARLDPGRPARPWLLQITRNQVRDLWRRQSVRSAEPLDPSALHASSDPEQDAERALLRARVWRAIARLDPAKREILVLRDFHDLSYRELALVLAIAPGTVMSRLHAARSQLRQELESSAPTGAACHD